RHLSREPRGTPGVYASRWASPASWAIIPDSMKLKHFLAFLFCSLLPVAAWIVAREERPPATPSVALAARTPLLFEENVGQTADAVRFLARAPGYALFLTDEEAVLRPAGENGAVRMRFPAAAVPRGEEPAVARTSYLGGERTFVDVPNFTRVR